VRYRDELSRIARSLAALMVWSIPESSRVPR
jgi:hypothetical protein